MIGNNGIMIRNIISLNKLNRKIKNIISVKKISTAPESHTDKNKSPQSVIGLSGFTSEPKTS